MKILVTTPAGNIGWRVLSELLAPEFSVRVIARDPSRLPAEIREQVELVRGSTDDPVALRRALEGVESLFWCVPTESRQETDVPGYYQRFARAASRAVGEAGTPRVVTISAGGKGLARNPSRLSGLHAMEEILDQSGAAIRHLRCGLFMENLLWQAGPICERGVVSFPMPGDIPIPMVAVSDIADAALRWLVRRDWKGVAGVAVHGPEDLSWNHAAEIVERILERPVRYKEASANHYVQSLVGCGASAEYARSVVGMFAEVGAGIARAEPRTAQSTTLTTLSAWTERDLLPLVQSLDAPARNEPNGVCVCQV
jgi:uncharacterized protein YbjT (DUF2867 family)